MSVKRKVFAKTLSVAGATLAAYQVLPLYSQVIKEASSPSQNVQVIPTKLTYQETSKVGVKRLGLTRTLLVVLEQNEKLHCIKIGAQGSTHLSGSIPTSLAKTETWAFSPDGTLLATTEQFYQPPPVDEEHTVIKLWHLPQLALRKQYSFAHFSSAGFSSDGRMLYALNSRKPTVAVDLHSDKQQKIKTGLGSSNAFVVSSAVGLIISLDSDDIGTALLAYDLQRKKEADDYLRDGFEFELLGKTVPEALFLAPDASFIWVNNVACSFNRQTLHVSKPFFVLPSEQERALWMDKQGRLLTVNFQDKVFRWWNVKQKRIMAQSAPISVQPQIVEPPPTTRLTYSAVSADGRYVAIAQNGKVQVWHLGLPQ